MSIRLNSKTRTLGHSESKILTIRQTVWPQHRPTDTVGITYRMNCNAACWWSSQKLLHETSTVMFVNMCQRMHYFTMGYSARVKYMECCWQLQVQGDAFTLGTGCFCMTSRRLSCRDLRLMLITELQPQTPGKSWAAVNKSPASGSQVSTHTWRHNKKYMSGATNKTYAQLYDKWQFKSKAGQSRNRRMN